MLTSTAPGPSQAKRPWWLPLSVLLLGAALLGLAQLWDLWDLPQVVLMPLFMASAALLIGALVILVPLCWFRSSLSRTTKLAGLGVVLALIAALARERISGVER